MITVESETLRSVPGPNGDLLGLRVNHLTVESVENGSCLCRCDCGGVRRVQASLVRSRSVKTCSRWCPYHSGSHPKWVPTEEEITLRAAEVRRRWADPSYLQRTAEGRV